MKGFRPGKAPRNVLTHLYGPQVQNDVANAIVNDDAAEGADREERHPGEPARSSRPGKVVPTEAFSYKARFEVQPDIEEVKYEGFELVRPRRRSTTKMVDEQLEALRLRHATLEGPRAGAPRAEGGRPHDRLHDRGRRAKR